MTLLILQRRQLLLVFLPRQTCIATSSLQYLYAVQFALKRSENKGKKSSDWHPRWRNVNNTDHTTYTGNWRRVKTKSNSDEAVNLQTCLSLKQHTSLVYANVKHVKSSSWVKSLQITQTMILSANCQHLGTTVLTFRSRLEAPSMNCNTHSLWCFPSCSPLMSCHLSHQLHNKSVKCP